MNTDDWVKVPGNASTTATTPSRTRAAPGPSSTTRPTPGTPRRSRPARPPPRSRPTSRQFDVWDRYDFDGDGNFNEPDGYIDHFQAVHAGEGEEAGAGADAIWSHRWYVNPTTTTASPGRVDGEHDLLGGTQIGDTGVWIGDYTVEPENGGLGVFAHEFGHDLGLPDFYDTAAARTAPRSGPLMSSGSWLTTAAAARASARTPAASARRRSSSSAGSTTRGGRRRDRSVVLSPSQHTYDDADQAVKVNLPDKSTRTDHTSPRRRADAWWSGRGDDLQQHADAQRPGRRDRHRHGRRLVRHRGGLRLPLRRVLHRRRRPWTRSARRSPASSTKWAARSGATRPAAPGRRSSASATPPTAACNQAGAFLDNIAIKAGRTHASPTAPRPTPPAGRPRAGRSRRHRAVIADALLPHREPAVRRLRRHAEEGPYQFSEAFTRPNWVEHFPFQNGMLVWLVDQGYADNNTIEHPVRATPCRSTRRPNSLTYHDGTARRNRREPFDATFGLDAVDPSACTSRSRQGQGQDHDRDLRGGGVPQQRDLRRHAGLGLLRRPPTRRTRSRSPGRASRRPSRAWTARRNMLVDVTY